VKSPLIKTTTIWNPILLKKKRLTKLYKKEYSTLLQNTEFRVQIFCNFQKETDFAYMIQQTLYHKHLCLEYPYEF